MTRQALSMVRASVWLTFTILLYESPVYTAQHTVLIFDIYPAFSVSQSERM